MSYNHLIRWKPLGNLFFGGENYDDSERRAFYLQHARPFPQQSGLLGLLRYELLRQNGHLGRSAPDAPYTVQDPGRAAALIGHHSFEIGKNHSYGALRRLSPVFLWHNGQAYHPFPKVKYYRNEADRKNGKYSLAEPDLSGGIAGLRAFDLGGRAAGSSLAALNHYSPKHGFEYGFRTLDGNDFKRFDEVFVDSDEAKERLAQTGIYKPHTLPYRQLDDTGDQEGFFKLHYQRLRPGWELACYLQLDQSDALQSAPVTMGKERSPFFMEVTATDELPQWEPSTGDGGPTPGSTLWLLSDSYLDPAKLYPLCEQVVLRPISFRNLRSRLKRDQGDPVHNYASQPARPGSEKAKTATLTLSHRYNFFRKGGLLHLRPDADPEAIRQLFQDDGLQKIGYNFYHAIN